MGGDEVFAGYPRYLARRALAGARRRCPPVREPASAAASNGHLTLGKPGRLRGPRRNLLKLLGGIDRDPCRSATSSYSSYYRRRGAERVLAPDVRAALAGHDPFRRHRRHFERVAAEHWLNQLLYVDPKTFLPCLNLAYTDKMSMAASTEVRVPLLDDEVVALAGADPAATSSCGASRGSTSSRRAWRACCPARSSGGRRRASARPVRAWLGRATCTAADRRRPGARQLRARGLFDPAAVQRLVARNDAGQEDNALRLWALLTLELWQREFMDAA